MAFKLLLAAERTWRRLNGHELLHSSPPASSSATACAWERDDTNTKIKNGRTKTTQIEEKGAA